jgi:hypothetical protein
MFELIEIKEEDIEGELLVNEKLSFLRANHEKNSLNIAKKG